MDAFSENLGLLTRKEKEWLLGNINLPKAYEYRLRSGIRKKLRILIEFELPLLSRSGLLDICSNRYYYNPKELHESWTGLGDGDYFNNSSLGKAKVLGPNPSQGLPFFRNGVRNGGTDNIENLQPVVRLPRQCSTRLVHSHAAL